MHIKYRPTSLNQVYGNSAIKKALGEYLYESPILFSGFAGCGKTTLAYIIAKNLGADDDTIKDVNCVHFSGVNDIRTEIDELNKPSLLNSNRVLILDEIHELSPKAQQVLLKPLENLKPNNLILACTTNTSKLKTTLLDRFLRLNVKPLTDNEAINLINYVCKQEQLSISKRIKVLLIKKSDGIPRRLLTGLTKIKGIEDEDEIKYLLDLNILEEVDKDTLTLFKTILSNSGWSIISNQLNSMLKEKSPESIRMELLSLIGSRIISKYFKSNKEGELLKKLFKELSIYRVPEKSNLLMSIYCSTGTKNNVKDDR